MAGEAGLGGRRAMTAWAGQVLPTPSVGGVQGGGGMRVWVGEASDSPSLGGVEAWGGGWHDR